MTSDIGQLWCPVEVSDATPEPSPEPQKDLGTFQYKVGIISDLHICKSNNNDSNNWWDEEDFKSAMGIFVDDPEVKFIASCGDVSES